MCGISGVFLFHQPVNSTALDQMGRRLAHRGPDHFATLVCDTLGFAHNRLSIVDITPAGDQPFTDGDHMLVYNGEIYNHLELRAGLAQRGVTFRGTSDTETLFACLNTYGVPATLAMIRGMFAFAYYHRPSQQLFLCRDRYGIKPLYWTRNHDGLYFASEVKALMVQPGVRVDPLRTLFSLNGSADQSNQYTIFENVFHVPPGSYLVIGAAHKPEIHSYDCILQDIDEHYYRELDRQPQAAIVDTFDQLLNRSVEKMLMSDVPLGVFASGGLDSSLIAAVARRINPDIQLFTSNIVGNLSELPFSHILSETIHAPLHVDDFSPADFLKYLAASTQHYETPLVKFANAVPFSRVAALARQHGVKPVLTGEGSDELFLGYPALHYKKYAKILDFPKDLIDRFYSLIPGINKYIENARSETINGFLPMLAAGFERQYLRETGGVDAYAFLGKEEARRHYQAVQMLREHLIALLHRNDRMGMQFSIESRFPFLDEEIIRFGVNLPLKWKIRTVPRVHDRKHPFLMDKAIVRMLARKYLPEKLADKPKWGFGMYGYRHMKTQPDYFFDGWLANLLKLDRATLQYIVETRDRKNVNQLVGVEVFGRIFDWGESPEAITERNLRSIQILPC